MRVNEIFYSLQGEGYYTGTPAVFVRLSGCNLKCPFCDTQHETFVEMSEEEIVSAVKAFPARHVVITGGEPTLQLSATLISLLHACGMFVQIETNGTRELPEGCDIDWITCSPKDGGRIAIQRIDELKVVFMDDKRQDMSQYAVISAREYRLQPLDTQNAERNQEIVNNTVNYILENPKWKLSLQTHKILNVR